jgi:hypothetical protein
MSDIVIPSSPDDLKKIKDAMKEMVDCMIRISAERELQKDIIDNLSEQFPDIPKKYFGRMAKVMFKNSFDQVTGEMSDFETLYEAIVK